ncbi:unnamed protein product [Cylicostephanus goldi]|uniref:Malate dehydrogenase n=1 Tax=Cylicostephanus goldi TaxID=71465 RepID=A0A3P7MNI9_CYLGO|nr:unnamed protein product [Cylicostephanus goldi]
MKQDNLVKHLALYDVVNTPGVAADLSHIDTNAKVTAHTGQGELAAAVANADIVVIPAGVPRKPGMTRDDLFNTNAGIVRDLVDVVAVEAPKALIAVITNPVNSTVPIASEVMKKHGVYDKKRIFGVTMLDVVRSQAFVAQLKSIKIAQCQVLFTQHISASVKSTQNLHRFQGSATLSMAVAGWRFTNALLRGLKGDKNVQCAYVANDSVKGVEYFSTPLELGPNGIEKILGVGKVNV